MGEGVPLGCVVDASENEHFLLEQGGAVGKSAAGLLPSHLYLLNPPHVLDVQHRYQIVAGLVLEVWGAVVASEEDHEHLVEDTCLLLDLLGVDSGDVGNGNPLFLADVEGVVVLEDGVAVSAEDDDFVAEGDLVVECPALGERLLGLGGGEGQAELGEGVVVLAPAEAWVGDQYLRRCRGSRRSSTSSAPPLACRAGRSPC